MLFIVITVLLGIIGIAALMVGLEQYEKTPCCIGCILVVIAIILSINGIVNGFIDYPPTQGSHQGVLTAVDLEGIYFRRYEIYLKSGELKEQGDETKYCLYADELELVKELQDNIGKRVKLNYSHKGGRIKWNSCGTYHVDSIEVLEEND